jgi:FkbM family methyltransferase
VAAPPNQPTKLPRLLKRLYRFRGEARGAARHSFSRLLRPRRKAALVAALRRDWPGGYALTDKGELAYVPAPLDVRGEHLLFYGFALPEPALAFVPPGGIAIDVGANLGEWAVPLARAVGASGRVVCCEPNPVVAAALAATLRINNLGQAEVLQVAISSADGEGHLAIDPGDSGLSRLAAGGIVVPLRALDSLVAEAALDRLDLIKIDVEGHEASVLAGATQTLRRFRPALIFESGHEAAGDRDRIAGLLEHSAYDIVAVLHHYGALACTMSDYRAGTGPSAGDALNLLALPAKR